MKTMVVLIFSSLLSVSILFAQTNVECNSKALYNDIQGLWINLYAPGSALEIVDSNAYFHFSTDPGSWQENPGEEFSIVCNKSNSFFIWWTDLIVQEFVLEGDTMLLLDWKQRSEKYIRAR